MANGFLVGSAYIRVTPDTTGFKADLDSRLAEESTTAKVPVTPDTTGFQEKLKLAVDKAQVTADVKVNVDSSGSGGGFEKLKNEASSAGGESGGMFENSFVQGAFGGKKTALITAAGTALAALPALAGIAGIGMGTELIAELGVHLAEKAPGLQASFDSLLGPVSKTTGKRSGGILAESLQEAFAPAVPAIAAILGQVPALMKSLQPQLAGVFSTIAPQLEAVFQGVTGVIKGLVGVMQAAAPAIGPFITAILGLVGNVLPGLSAIISATVPEVSVFGATIGKLGASLGQMFTAMAPAVGDSMKVLSALLGVVGGLLPVIGKLADAFAAALAPVLVSFGKAITALMPVIDAIGKTLGAFAGAVLTSLSGALQAVGKVIESLAPSLARLAAAFTQVFTVWENTGVFNDLEDAFEALVKPLAAIISALVSGLAPILPIVLGAVAQFAGVLQGALIQAVTALAPPLTQLITVTLASLQQILPAILPLLTEFAALLANGLADVISGIAVALTAVMNAMGPTALGALVVAIGAVALGMKAWAAATAAVEASSLITVIAGWVTGIQTFAEATEGATIAQKALLAAEAASDALNPFGWVALAVTGIVALGGAILLAKDNSTTLTGALAEQNGAVGYNVAGWQKYETALQQANDKVTQVINTGNLQGQQLAHAEQMQGQYTAALQQTFTQLDLLSTRLTTVGNTYGLTTQQVVKLAEEAGISSSAFSGTAAAADKATQKLAAYIIQNQDALAPQQEVNSLMQIFGSSAFTASTQTAALNTAWQLLVGNFVSKQQAMLNASTAVQQYSTAAKQAGGNTQQLQLQFYSTITALQPLIDQISKTHAPMGTLYQDLENQIKALQQSGPLNTQEQQALQRLQTLADALANSTHGMTTAQQQAATSLENQLIPQLNDLGVKSTTSQTDVKNLTDAITNTGTQSAATAADRAQLISDLEKAGVSAQTATQLVANFIAQVGKIQASKTTDIIVHGDGTYSVAGNAVKATAAGWLVAGGTPGKDSVPIMAMPGELVVPTPLVQSGAVDHLRGMIPGFAAGGVVSGNYSGALGGAGPFVTGEYNQTTTTIEAAVAAAAAAAMKAAAVPAGGKSPADLIQIENWWTGAGGPGGNTAHIAAAITGAESGFNIKAVQQGQPYACVPLRTRILTRRGWLRHDEVRIGDETIGYNPDTGRSEWTRVTEVVHYDEADVWRIGNKRWSADVTPNHRWWSDTETEGGTRGEFVRTHDLGSHHRIRLAARADTDGIPGLSLEECAIVAWLMGDGHVYQDGRWRGGHRSGEGVAQAKLSNEKAAELRARYEREHGTITQEDLGAEYGISQGAVSRIVRGLGYAERPAAEPGGLRWEARIYQSKPEQVERLRALLATIPHTESTRQRATGNLPAYEFRLARSYASDLLKRAQWDELTPEEFVLTLSPDQRAAWLAAMIDAEGNYVKDPLVQRGPSRGARPSPGTFTRVSQVDGPIQDAITLAVYLEGWNPSRSLVRPEGSRREHQQPSANIGMRRPHVTAGRSHTVTVLEKQPVWCPTTELGTWTADQDKHVFLTGNTTGWGLWQITPGDSEPQFGINSALLTGPTNAEAAVAKYRGAGGFSPWTTYESGAYEKFMDTGGWLMPGSTLVHNNTGHPEHVSPPGREPAPAAPKVISPVFNYFGPQSPTPEQQQAMLVNLATMVGAAG